MTDKAAPKDNAPRREAYKRGVFAEKKAAALLALKGFHVLDARWKSPVGEIDLVLARGSLIVFCEVKQRRAIDDGIEAVTPRQQQRIYRAAEAWFAAHPDRIGCDARFDVVVVAPYRLPRHIPDAFRLD